MASDIPAEPHSAHQQETPPDSQGQYEVRFDWGMAGAESIVPGTGVIVVLDPLSFTTTVQLAVELGLEVLPHAGEGDSAQAAFDADAAVAAGRGTDAVSLSPSSIIAENIVTLYPSGRVLMESRDGSRLCAGLRTSGIPVVAASMRNRTAVAQWILQLQTTLGVRVRVAVVAAGEARPDGSIRFAVEDQLAAGAVIDALAIVGIDYCSPEAAAACAVFTSLRRAADHMFTASASGQELISAGARADVELAAELDVSDVVPVLGDFGFRG